MTFILSPLTRITNLYEQWLRGIAKKEQMQIRVGECAILWALWYVKMAMLLIEGSVFFAGYVVDYPLDPYGVLSSINGATIRH
jgi:hypothetical protein